MARLFVAHVEGGKQDPMAGVADAIEERRRRQFEEQAARDQLALQNTALDLERQGLRLQRFGIAQQGVRLGMELDTREKIARMGEEGATGRQQSAQEFQAELTEKGQTFEAEQRSLDRTAQKEESQAARDFQAEQNELQRTSVSAEKAADRLAASDALDKNLQAQMVQLDKQIEAAKAEGDSQREAQLNLQKNQLEATAQENDKNRKASFKAARQERKAEMARLQKQIDSAEKIATDRIKTELEALDKEIQSRYTMQAAELRAAKEARDDERVARATAQMREIEAEKAAQERAIKANKEQYQSEAASAASRQLRALEAEAKESDKQRRFAGKQARLGREFESGESSKERLFRGGQAKEDRDQQLAIVDAQIAAAREEGDKDRESRLVLQRQQLEAAREEGAADRASREGMQQSALAAEKENLLERLASAEREGNANRAAQLESDIRRIDAQMQVAEMQYGMPGGMAQQTVDTLNAQVESLDRIFDSLPEGQRPPAAARQRGKEALAEATQSILSARTKEEYNAAVSNAGQLYRSYQEEMQAAGQAVFTGRQNDRYNELMEWAGSDLGREHGITEARLAEVVTGDPSKRAEDISNLVAMKRGAQAYRRAELALDQLEEGGNTRIEGLKEVMGGIAPDGTYDSSKLNPVQKLAAEAFAGMNDVGLSMTERAQAAQTLMRYANMTEDDEKFVSMTLESERQERSAMDLERNANWVRSALAGPDAEFREQDIMEPDFQDRLAALAAGSAGPNKRGIAKAASIALGIITQQDFATLGAGGYRQLWAEIGTQLDPRVLQQLGRELQAVDFSMPSSAAPSGPVGQKLQRMKDNLTGTQQ